MNDVEIRLYIDVLQMMLYLCCIKFPKLEKRYKHS